MRGPDVYVGEAITVSLTDLLDAPQRLAEAKPKSIEDLVACPACGCSVHPPKGCPAGLVFTE